MKFGWVRGVCSNPPGSISFDTFSGVFLGLPGEFPMVIPGVYSLLCEKEPFVVSTSNWTLSGSYRASPGRFPRFFLQLFASRQQWFESRSYILAEKGTYSKVLVLRFFNNTDLPDQ
jgi:hypothetical protein